MFVMMTTPTTFPIAMAPPIATIGMRMMILIPIGAVRSTGGSASRASAAMGQVDPDT